jgi:hypothetical protein
VLLVLFVTLSSVVLSSLVSNRSGSCSDLGAGKEIGEGGTTYSYKDLRGSTFGCSTHISPSYS